MRISLAPLACLVLVLPRLAAATGSTHTVALSKKALLLADPADEGQIFDDTEDVSEPSSVDLVVRSSEGLEALAAAAAAAGALSSNETSDVSVVMLKVPKSQRKHATSYQYSSLRAKKAAAKAKAKAKAKARGRKQRAAASSAAKKAAARGKSEAASRKAALPVVVISSSPQPAAAATPASAPAAATPAAATTPAASPAPASSDFQTLALTTMNNFRAKHAAAPLVWSSALEAAAQRWANNCEFEHSKGAVGPYGENLAAFGGGGDSIGAAIDMWNAEAPEYDPANPVASHFTQDVWKATTQLGCAVAKCNLSNFDPKFWPATFFVCEFAEPGNVFPASHFRENVSP